MESHSDRWRDFSKLQLVNVRVKDQTGLLSSSPFTFQNFPNHTDLFVKVSRLNDNELCKLWGHRSQYSIISTVISKAGLEEGTGLYVFIETWLTLVLIALACFSVQANWFHTQAPGPASLSYEKVTWLSKRGDWSQIAAESCNHGWKMEALQTHHCHTCCFLAQRC